MNMLKLALIVFYFIASFALAAPPSVPETKLKHREEFIDKDTKEQRRLYKTDYSMGAEIWDSARKKYVKHGVFLTFHSNKAVNNVTTWNYGVREGSHERYDKNGVLKEEGFYSNGKKEGEWKTYTDKGRLFQKSQYKGGKRDGETIDYNTYVKRDGQPQFIKMYKNGKLHGPHEQYNDKGQKVIWGTYVEGKREGSWCDYDWNRKVRCRSWVNGKRQDG